MTVDVNSLETVAPATYHFYRHALEILNQSGVPFLIGGAYALNYYTGITRHTKDLDIFVPAAEMPRTREVFAAAGYRTEVIFTHWLAKVFHGEDFVDIIFSSGNGLCPVDAAWFAHAVAGEVLGVPMRLLPVEEMIWQKAYIMERERFDGADVLHLLRARGPQLDWQRLLARFGPYWRVLLSHLLLFDFVYPDDPECVPAAVRQQLAARLEEEPARVSAGTVRLCRGPLLSRTQYLPDVERWGYADPRLEPTGSMTREQVTRWTDAGR